jgi:hypothetical protein
MFRLISLAACAASSLMSTGASFLMGYGCGACARRETEPAPKVEGERAAQRAARRASPRTASQPEG